MNSKSFLFESFSKQSNLVRASILFSLGFGMGFVLNLLQMEYKSNLFPRNMIFFLQYNWWTLPLCGLAASIFKKNKKISFLFYQRYSYFRLFTFKIQYFLDF